MSARPHASASAPVTGRGRPPVRTGWRFGVMVASSSALLVAAVVCSLAFGAKSTGWSDAIGGLLHSVPRNSNEVIVRELRLDRTVLGVVVGVALGAAGAVMQGLTRNPLADPGILGVSAGASLGVVLAIAGFGVTTASGYVWFAFVGAAVAAVVVYVLSGPGRGGGSVMSLALAGAVLTVLIGSFTSAILLQDIDVLDAFRFWAAGSLAGRPAGVIGQMLPFVVVGAVLALGSGRALNALAFGDELAQGIGVHVGRARLVAGLSVVVLVGAATAAAGPIGFVGLAVPHLARAMAGSDYRRVLVLSTLLGPVLLLGADTLGRVLGRPGEVQVGIMTALLGAPFFVVLVRRRRVAGL